MERGRRVDNEMLNRSSRATGINWRQPAITQFFKPALRTLRTRTRRSWADAPEKTIGPPRKRKVNYIDTTLVKNKNLTVHNVFDSIVLEDETVYWEFKAG